MFSAIHELITSRCRNWLLKRWRKQIKLLTFVESKRKQERSRKTSTFASLTILKSLTVCVLYAQSVVYESLQSHGLYPTRLLCPWDFLRSNTGVACHFLLQGIFLTQGYNPRLSHILHWQVDLFIYFDLFISSTSNSWKALGSQNNCGKFLKRWEYQAILPLS